ncbi:hypothetical protein QFZ34_003261 [Phyllobacterium ifriqiyense]|uniref:Uncharacterized protein n=1 Tax=Phyllobacterium ifriqiyense TaxID=314238 RepID=A0ABU0SBE5_9HYPH|nr:hypothetical protein [Phyllobacterium ifriqiyense]MDQ0998079.1 hypothetical protein [Phyllobacterium ifriqiyense]
MTNVSSGVPATVSAIQFAKQAAALGMLGIWPVAEMVRRDCPRLEAAFRHDYGNLLAT